MLEEEHRGSESPWEKALSTLATEARILIERIGERKRSQGGYTPEEEKTFWDTVRADAQRFIATLDSYRAGQPESNDRIDSKIRYIENMVRPYLRDRAE